MSPLSSLIPQDYGLWRNSIQQRIYNAPDQHRFFWLIDPYAHDELPGLIWKLDPQPDVWPLYMNTYMEDAINSGPFMVPYRPNSEFTKWVLQELRLVPLGCLIEVEGASVHIAFEHLQNLLECMDGEGKLSIFRFYDPRIAYGISTYEDKATCLRILGPVLRLDLWELGRCAPVHMGIGIDSGIRNAGMESYDTAFFEHIWDEVKIHSTIGTLGREPGMKLRSLPLPEAYSLVERVYHILSRYGYDDRRSLAYGSSVTARLGLEVWERPDLREELQGRPANAPLAEILNMMDL
jgi:hypothetical protein